jgi:formylglycine-generating enzyme required for sulfatase activity
MGSPDGEDGRETNEKRHYRRIERPVAVATMEVTADQFRKYMLQKAKSAYNPAGRAAGEPGMVANRIRWYYAAAYCNWLSELDGLPETEWCYPREVKAGEKPPAHALARIGYRLPTEAEWEYFCRAGSDTSRPFGGSGALLSRYAWTWLNAGDRAHPPGRLLPNQFGLFDILGNVEEWCHDGPKDPDIAYQDEYPDGTPEKPAPDVVVDVPVLSDGVWHYIRGGSYEESPFKARSAYRDEGPPHEKNLRTRWGFRVMRTRPSEPR